MDLKTYLSQERGRAADLARTLDVSSVTIHQWAHGPKQVPAERCPEIEKATDGVVTCEELRADLAEKWAYLRGTVPGYRGPEHRDPAREIPQVMPAKRSTNGA